VTAYVALLRGVNVGGRSKLEMKDLKRQVEDLGCSDVSTYINSGNVLFRDRRSAKTLTKLFEETLGRRVAIRSRRQMEALCARIPDDWTNDKEQKTDVGFVLDAEDELLWNASRKDLRRGDGPTWEAEVTARNVNTVRKLTSLLADM
jgi:uncharacterized protein (DUF1697 family)